MHRKYKMATWAVACALVLTVLVIGWAAKDKALAMPAFADVPARILPAAPPELPVVTPPEKTERTDAPAAETAPIGEQPAQMNATETTEADEVMSPATVNPTVGGLQDVIGMIDELRDVIGGIDPVATVEETSVATEHTPAATAEAQVDAAWERWEELNIERDRLQQQLVDVYSEQLALANEIWPAQLERLQQFINDQLGAFSTDIDQWIPPALSEFIATKTGKSVTEWEDYIWGAPQADNDIES